MKAGSILDRLKTSTKWKLGLGGVLWVLFQPWLIKVGLTEDQFSNVLYVALATLLGQGMADWGKEAGGAKS